MRDYLQKARTYIADRKLFFSLSLVVLVAMTLTLVSVSLYYSGGYYRLDLSRPGYEHERTEISRPSAEKTYDTTSPVTTKTITDFLTEFDAHQTNLEAYGDFRDDSLSDEDLQINQQSVQPQ